MTHPNAKQKPAAPSLGEQSRVGSDDYGGGELMTTNNQCSLTDDDIVNKAKKWANNDGLFDSLEFDYASIIVFSEAIIQANDEARRKAGWLISPPLPIEDAPKDGTLLLLYGRNRGFLTEDKFFTGFYETGENRDATPSWRTYENCRAQPIRAYNLPKPQESEAE